MGESLKIEDWSKGVTDDYEDADPRFSRELVNLLLTRKGKLYQRPGTEMWNASIPQLPSGNQKIDGLYYFDSTIFAKSGTKLYHAADGALFFTTLPGLGGVDAFADSELGAKWSVSEWRGHLFITPQPGSTKKSGCRTIMVYKNGSSAWTACQVGLPRMEDWTSGGLNVETSGEDNVLTYLVPYRTYTAKVDGVTVTFEDYGTPTEQQWSFVDIATCSDGNRTWTNGATDNYEDAQMAIRIFRTKSGDVVPLYSAQKAQSATINFTVTDANLGAEAYWTGGVSYWDPPPLSFGSLIIGSTAFYFGGTDVDSGQVYNTRVWQSDPVNPKGVPGGNFVDVPAKIVAWGKINVYPIVFSRKECYRIEGRFDRYGGGGMVAKRISATEGAISDDAIIETDEGIFFASETGWCFTDGFQVVKLAKHLAETYKALYTKSAMSGCFDAKNRHVWFSVEDRTLDASNTGNPNGFYVLDLNHTQGDQGVFLKQKMDGQASAYCMHYDSANDRILIGDRRGYIMVLDGTKTVDLTVNTAVAYSTWARQGIVWAWKSPAFSFGSSLVTKFATRLHIVAKNLSASFSADLSTQVDDGTTEYAITEIRKRSAVATGLHKVWRWFKKGALRSRYRQVNLTKGYVNLLRSDDYGTATVNTAGKTAQRLAGSWPEDGTYNLVGHRIAFESENYAVDHEITVDSGDTLTMATAPAGNPAGTGWIVRGYPKTESVELHGVEIEYMLEDQQVDGFRSGDDHGNA